MPKIIAQCCLHYGSDYLDASIRSIIDAVDEYWCLYTPQGSFGHHTDLPCPDTREQLFAIAAAAAGDKLRWVDGVYHSESQHRDLIFQLVPDADVIFIVDADEVWEAGLTDDILRYYETTSTRTLRLPTMQYWRSLYRAIPNDGMHAEHVYFPKNSGMDKPTLNTEHKIHHFGYAQRLEVMYYKQYTHGHKPEWRWDWYETKVLTNAQQDVHPVVFNVWNPIAVNPYEYGLPGWMREHPYAKVEVIT